MKHTVTNTCKHCGSSEIQKNGLSEDGIQRWQCLSCERSFELADSNEGKEKSSSKKIFVFLGAILFLFLGILFLAGLYFRYMPDKNYSKVKADYTLQATALLSEFEKNEAKANQKYMDKVIEVNGIIAEITKDQKGATVVALRNTEAFSGVLCTLQESSDEAIQKYAIGKSIKIRGVCTGMLMDVVLNKCVVIKE